MTSAYTTFKYPKSAHDFRRTVKKNGQPYKERYYASKLYFYEVVRPRSIAHFYMLVSWCLEHSVKWYGCHGRIDIALEVPTNNVGLLRDSGLLDCIVKGE